MRLVDASTLLARLTKPAPARRRMAIAGCLVLSAIATGCETERRRFADTVASVPADNGVRQSPLKPGEPVADTLPPLPYEETAYAISEGQRLYAWYNCAGCHATNGGGGMGPPLIDGEWIYGSSPENIYATIVEGRPNGMPSWRGRIPRSQVWQIVAYVRTMSGLTPQIARASRTDHMMALPGSQLLQQKDEPQQSFVPPASTLP